MTNDTTLIIRLPQRLKEALKEQALAQGLSLSAYVKLLLGGANASNRLEN